MQLTARLFARLTQIGYMPPLKATRAFSEAGFIVKQQSPSRCTQEWYRLELPNGDISFLIFPGSKTVADWCRNVEIKPCYSLTPFGMLHAGFVGNVAENMSPIGDILKPTYFIGHSAGGAAAAIVASQFSQIAFGVYGFGTPKFCDPTWARNYDSRLGDKTTFFENVDDVIPMLPPASRFTTPGATVRLGSESASSQQLLNLLQGAYNLPRVLTGHDIQRYIERLPNE